MRVGLGLAALGRPAYINLGREGALPAERTVDAMRDATRRVLDAAYDAGIRWVDVARSYGRAEEFLAGWLDDRGVGDLTISSKWGYAYVGDWRLDADVHEVKEHTLDQFTRQWAQSRDLLGDRLAMYQVHSLTPDSPVFTDQQLLEALAVLSDQGVRVGFSTSGPEQEAVVDRALSLRVSGRPVFTAVQSTWNLLEPSVGPALERAHRHGVHVLVKESLANGRLAESPPTALAEIAARYGVGSDAIAIAAVLHLPWVDTVLSGAASTEQLTSNLLGRTVRLTDPDLAELDALREPATDYWSLRGAMTWE